MKHQVNSVLEPLLKRFQFGEKCHSKNEMIFASNFYHSLYYCIHGHSFSIICTDINWSLLSILASLKKFPVTRSFETVLSMLVKSRRAWDTSGNSFEAILEMVKPKSSPHVFELVSNRGSFWNLVGSRWGFLWTLHY